MSKKVQLPPYDSTYQNKRVEISAYLDRFGTVNIAAKAGDTERIIAFFEKGKLELMPVADEEERLKFSGFLQFKKGDAMLKVVR